MIEWIIVDDCPSSPPPLEIRCILEQHRIGVISPAFNLGRSRARNLGASFANGTWIEFIDGDDVPLTVDLNCLHPTAKLVIFPVLEFPENEILPPPQYDKIEIKSNWSGFLPKLHPVDVRPAALIWRISFFKETTGFDARFDGGEDFELMVRANCLSPQVHRHDCPKQAYRRREGNLSLGRLYIESHIKLFEHHFIKSTEATISKQANIFLGKEYLFSAYTHGKLLLMNSGKITRFVILRIFGI